MQTLALVTCSKLCSSGLSEPSSLLLGLGRGQSGKAVDPDVWPIASLEVVVKIFCGCDQHLQLSDQKSP